MSKKERLGYNPLENLIQDTRKGKQKRREPRKAESQEIKTSRNQDVRTSRLLSKKNFYESKRTGQIIQKVTIHLPFELVEELKIAALRERKTLSEIVREKLK